MLHAMAVIVTAAMTNSAIGDSGFEVITKTSPDMSIARTRHEAMSDGCWS
jgi:hypothetical protein